MITSLISLERACNLIISPQVSEKATFIVEKNNQVIFFVVRDCNKIEIKQAIELIWKKQNIKVESVQISNLKGKKKRFGRYFGSKNDRKKAYVSIKGKQEIDFTDVKLFEDR
ncbi:MAG: 50S ribosomal protein L23 [Nitrosomonas sp.]|nr:50S ribosomal protein L23 [Nitrosomonas sp.]